MLGQITKEHNISAPRRMLHPASAFITELNFQIHTTRELLVDFVLHSQLDLSLTGCSPDEDQFNTGSKPVLAKFWALYHWNCHYYGILSDCYQIKVRCLRTTGESILWWLLVLE
jgi:hypothetical protein